MLARVASGAVLGVGAYQVDIEVDVAGGLPAVTVVGLPDAAVRESRDRVRAAVRNSGYEFPAQRVTVNLAPADVKKEGVGFDLPIALGILSATGQLDDKPLGRFIFLGELSLDGNVRAVAGVLPMAAELKKSGRAFVVARANANEAAVVEGLSVYPVGSLCEAVELAKAAELPEPHRIDARGLFGERGSYNVDFSEVRAQEHVKRALEVAVAGGHNMLMIGPPGAGKTMLSRRLPTIIPDMTFEESLETTKIHSIAGLIPAGDALVTQRPFRCPHHTVSDAGLVGGGAIPHPGEVSLAHNGVLFLDELPEFGRSALEALRQPMEDGVVTISRASGSLMFPARFMLAAAMNPCPCGFLTDSRRRCRCSPAEVERYRSRISGPLLDRIDIQVEVPGLDHGDMAGDGEAESSLDIRRRVENARAVQTERFQAREGVFSNGHMQLRHIKEFCTLDADAKRLLGLAMSKLGLSARAYHRILKVARTIADLDGCDGIAASHVSEAVQYRSLDRPLAA